ncbi:hypothetical protein VZT92_024532 [Zoarces viviparus]|uniref:DNA damage-binding protein 2 n=1 Tax=Zoarces viviparus TaxID=48416 RepID=A0AAW1E3H0_ZOAVI
MKTRQTKSADAPEPKAELKKRTAGSSGPTPSRKRWDRKDGETSKQSPPVKSARVQKRGGYGSILHYIYKSTLGQSLHSQMRQCLQGPFVRSLSSYHFHRAKSPFRMMINFLEWHPTHPTTLALGSNGGDICLWDFEVPTKKVFLQGSGAGDFIGGMTFCPTDLSRVYVVSGLTARVWDRLIIDRG